MRSLKVSVYILFSPVHTNSFSLENQENMGFCEKANFLRRTKTLMKVTVYAAFLRTIFKSVASSKYSTFKIVFQRYR